MEESHFTPITGRGGRDEDESAEVGGFALELDQFEVQLRNLLLGRQNSTGAGPHNQKS